MEQTNHSGPMRGEHIAEDRGVVVVVVVGGGGGGGGGGVGGGGGGGGWQNLSYSI